ncbi:MAG TPA: GvpL/GvpF family gas vesicle protein [Solirubrobacterales bacterium]|jgi:hypothetical protein|nr:GvpL/GvpF family gas vesicle protein [Solirubrobacterales bacterium]
MAKGKANGGGPKYVYGVVRARRSSRLKQSGIRDAPIKVVAHKGIGALTSDVPDAELEAGRDELLTHSGVLERALQKGVVLPMRFGIVMPDEGSVRDRLLEAHREELEAQLDEMDGKAEVNVKGIYDEATVLREVVDEDQEIAALRESIQGQPEDATYFERIRVGELVSGALDRKRAEDERWIVDQLLPHSVAVEVGEPVHERMAVNASFLVEHQQRSEFDRALDGIASELGGRIKFKYTGPLPPHSFVELSVEA